jgi:hypothetical protein
MWELAVKTNGKNCYSAGNYQLMDEGSTRGMVIPTGIASSLARNPPDKWDSARLPAHGRGIHMRISLGSSWTLIQTGKIKIRNAKNPLTGKNSRISNSKCSLLGM